MRRRTLPVLLLALVVVAAMAAVASAGKPTCEEDPTRPWCDTTPSTTEPPPNTYWTCEARNANGAGWPIGGDFDGTSYPGDSIPVCIDIDEDHLDVDEWTVTWSGTTAKGTETVKGLKLVFEEEIHDNVFAEHVFTTVGGTWTAGLSFGGEGDSAGNMVFVAMPHSGDKWIESSITVTPVLP